MVNHRIRLCVVLLLVFLPSCVTKALWSDSLRTDGQLDTLVPAFVVDDLAYVAADEKAMALAIRVGEADPRRCILRQVPGDPGSLATALRQARSHGASLRFHAQLDSAGATISTKALLIAAGTTQAEELWVAMVVSPIDADDPDVVASGAPVRVTSCTWTTQQPMEIGTDYLGIAWRIGLTPFALGADAMANLPMAAAVCAHGVVCSLTTPLAALLGLAYY